MKIQVGARLDSIRQPMPFFTNSLQFYPKLKQHCFVLIQLDQSIKLSVASKLLNYTDYQYFGALLQNRLTVEQILSLIFRIIRKPFEESSSQLQFYINNIINI